MASFSYGTTSTYYYGASTVEYVKEEPEYHASIKKTKPPGDTWSDVIVISYRGITYAKGQLIKAEHAAIGRKTCEIIGFKASSVELRYIGSHKTMTLSYEFIRPLGSHDKVGKLDPNTAFRYHKKKKRKEIY